MEISHYYRDPPEPQDPPDFVCWYCDSIMDEQNYEGKDKIFLKCGNCTNHMEMLEERLSHLEIKANGDFNKMTATENPVRAFFTSVIINTVSLLLLIFAAVMSLGGKNGK